MLPIMGVRLDVTCVAKALTNTIKKKTQRFH